jgi:hypothetical protein
MDFWEDVLGYIADERVVPVVGPELLKVTVDGQETMLYPYIAKVLAGELGISTETPGGAGLINDVVCQYLQTGRPPTTVYRRIRSIVDRTTFGVPDSLLKLARIKPLRLFVSTTFDSLLERALNQVRFSGSPFTISRTYVPNQVREEADLPDDFHRVNDPVVFRLYGKVTAIPDYVVTEEDTLEFIHSLQSPERRPNRLFDEMKNHHLLFIGNNFSDWLARFFIRLTRGDRFLAGNNTMMQYLAEEQVRKDANFIFFLKSFGRNSAEIFTETSPIEFVDELWKRFHEAYPELCLSEEETTITKTTPTQDDEMIFISYAREDSKAAFAVADALKAAGLNVWLDRGRISIGEQWSDKIHQNVLKCALFFPIISRNTARRREGVFEEEWKLAEKRAQRMKQGEVFIIPIPVDDTPVPPRFTQMHYEACPGGQLAPAVVHRVREVLEQMREETGATAHA